MATFAYATTATAIAAFSILLPLSYSSESILDHHHHDTSSSVTQSSFGVSFEFREVQLPSVLKGHIWTTSLGISSRNLDGKKLDTRELLRKL
ncbi:hypothetical protein ACFX2J_021535 [Malus domestica]